MSISANIIQQAFSPLIKVFEEILVFIHAHFVHSSWGLAIVLLTVLIRAILVPVTYKQLKSMQEMQRLAPEINKLKEKYKDDKQRQQQEIMKFYQANKINPLASCLPFALQLPVFISLFYMLRTDLKKQICGPQLVKYFNGHPAEAAKYKHAIPVDMFSHLPAKFVESTGCQTVAPGSAKFLFIPDITAKATGVVLVVLIALYIASQIASTLLATATADPNQRRLMLALPLVIVAFLFRYPAGLLVYWITTNCWTIVQQYFIRRRIGPAPPKAPKVVESSNGRAKTAPAPALAAAGAGGGTAAPPPQSPRKKKKRSGRRR
jgi:YidC/Oxa1 family membrane protein insertase